MSAVIAMSVVICLSALIFSLLISFSLTDRIDIQHFNKTALINKAKVDFIDNGTMDGEYDYYFTIVEGPNPSYKALVCSKNREITPDNIYFYMIYDFDGGTFLAIQSENLYITAREEGGVISHYLADIIKFEGASV